MLDLHGEVSEGSQASRAVFGAAAEWLLVSPDSQGPEAILQQEGEGNWIWLHADHHDDAYDWAERRQAQQHPVTKVWQLVEDPTPVQSALADSTQPTQKRIFQDRPDDYLLSLGAPQEWLPTLRLLSNEEQLLEVIYKLPQDVGDRLLRVANGEVVTPPLPLPSSSFQDSPSFYVVEGEADLQRFLNEPLQKWLTFLHPTQRRLATGSFSGPVKITGSAGTGKTVVALHRAHHLAKQGKRVLLATYVGSLAQNLLRNLELLCTPEELQRIRVTTVHAEALERVRESRPHVQALPGEDLKAWIQQARTLSESHDSDFLVAEWGKVVAPQGIRSWDDYRGARRTGRGRAVSVKERREIWRVFEVVVERMQREKREDFSGLCRLATELLQEQRVKSPYDAIVVDEVQDLEPQEIKLLAALAGEGADRLTLCGDAGQAIYNASFSLSKLGIQTRGRSHILRINYRTTEQIRRFADQVLGDEVSDLDDGTESRKGTRSVLRGPQPTVVACANAEEQRKLIIERLRELIQRGFAPEEIALFTRTNKLRDEHLRNLRQENLACGALDRERVLGTPVGTFHKAKGLEFKQVLVADCNESMVPLRSALQSISDAADVREFEQNECRLLYVALTRARDEVTVFHVGNPSRFLPSVPKEVICAHNL